MSEFDKMNEKQQLIQASSSTSPKSKLYSIEMLLKNQRGPEPEIKKADAEIGEKDFAAARLKNWSKFFEQKSTETGKAAGNFGKT